MDLLSTIRPTATRGLQAPCGMSMRYDRRLSQPGVAKPRVAATSTFKLGDNQVEIINAPFGDNNSRTFF